MKKASRIWKILMVSVWVLLGSGLVVLFVAAMQSRTTKPCKDVMITIRGGEKHPFINKKDILSELDPGGLDYLRGRSVKEFNLRKMEDRLKKNPWVHSAELFFDNQHILQVSVSVNIPVARVFTVKGNSFYIDSSMQELPLSDRYTPRLPVFTGFPSEKISKNTKDSLLLSQVKSIAMYLNSHPFWMAQIDQVDINAGRSFEMIPKVGDHLIVFGDGKEIDQRFHKLGVFYSQVLSKSGWNDYSVLDIQFGDQVVATKRNVTYHKADTAAEKKWMKEWQKISEQMLAADTLQRVLPTTEASTQPENPSTQPMKTSPSSANPDPGKSKHSGTKGEVPAERQEPKAVYPPGKKT